MQKTEHYQLNQWEPSDPICRTDFNQDNAAIDAAVKAVESGAAQALANYKTANDAVVAKKAESSSVTALQQSVNIEFAAVAANLGSAGKNARIAWGSYTGTGTYGSKTPTSLTFDFYPVVVIIVCPKYASSTLGPAIFIRDSTAGSSHSEADDTVKLVLTWSDNSVSWYASSYATLNASDQINEETPYYYAVIGYDFAAQEA